jgi:hypothetical protein
VCTVLKQAPSCAQPSPESCNIAGIVFGSGNEMLALHACCRGLCFLVVHQRVSGNSVVLAELFALAWCSEFVLLDLRFGMGRDSQLGCGFPFKLSFHMRSHVAFPMVASVIPPSYEGGISADWDLEPEPEESRVALSLVFAAAFLSMMLYLHLVRSLS